MIIQCTDYVFRLHDIELVSVISDADSMHGTGRIRKHES